MRLPSGTPLESGLSLAQTDFKQRLGQLMDQSFSGYVTLQVEGFDGLEEGFFLFKNGQIQGALYEYLKFDVTVVGDVALTHCFNAAGADFGVIDIISLSTLQVDMAIAFDEKIKLTQSVDKRNLNAQSFKDFTSDLAQKTLSAAVNRDNAGKQDLFKKFGLKNMSN